MTDSPNPYDHFQTMADAPVEAGVYRVVGTPNGDVTLLRVADDSGTRRNTGDVVHVSPSTLVAQFETAENPDAGFSLGTAIDDVVASVKAAVGLFR